MAVANNPEDAAARGINSGDMIRVNTETGEYLSRV